MARTTCHPRVSEPLLARLCSRSLRRLIQQPNRQTRSALLRCNTRGGTGGTPFAYSIGGGYRAGVGRLIGQPGYRDGRICTGTCVCGGAIGTSSRVTRDR